MPNQLSGGEQQRVAIARALMGDADILLADEPTGNLDSRNAANIMAALKELNAQGKTIILITHDGEVAKQCKTGIPRPGRPAFRVGGNSGVESSPRNGSAKFRHFASA